MPAAHWLLADAEGGPRQREPKTHASNVAVRFILQLLPEALTAAENSGLRAFLAQQFVDQIEAVELAPLAAAFLRDYFHRRSLSPAHPR